MDANEDAQMTYNEEPNADGANLGRCIRISPQPSLRADKKAAEVVAQRVVAPAIDAHPIAPALPGTVGAQVDRCSARC
jgi:hypothetical protein